MTYHKWLIDEIGEARADLAEHTSNPFITHTDHLKATAARARLTALIDAQIAFLTHRLDQLEGNG